MDKKTNQNQSPKKEDDQLNESNQWARTFFSERCRILEFYVTTLIVMFGGIWFLGKRNLCDELFEVICILLAIILIHSIFFILFKAINTRLLNENNPKRYDMPHAGEARYGQKKIRDLGYWVIGIGGLLLTLFLWYIYNDCNSCDKCESWAKKIEAESKTEISISIPNK